MKRFTALFLIAALLFALLPPGVAQAASDYSWVRVKLTTNNATTLKFSIYGSYFIEESGAEFTGGTLTVSVDASRNLTLQHSSAGLLYTGKSASIRRVTVDASGGSVVIDSKRYLGHFLLKVTSSGYIQVINQVPMAHYLYGVVAFEMNNLYPIEALKAQALAAKGYVMNQMSPSKEYDIGDTSAEQVYKGYNAGYTSVIQAVDSTISEVLTLGGSVLRTYFAASNGGETSLPRYAWVGRASDGYAVSIDDYDFMNPLCLSEARKLPLGPVERYSYAAPLYAMLLGLASQKVGVTLNYLDYVYGVQTYGPAYEGTTRNLTRGTVTLKASARSDTGELIQEADSVTVEFRLSDFETYGVMTDTRLRIYWGADGGDGYYYFYRVRYGHGVGMSQRGAEQRAKSGHSYRDILAFYYPGATLSYLAIDPPQDMENRNKASSGVNLLAQTTGSVNLRQQADSNSKKLDTVPKDIRLTVTGRQNGWAYTVYNGQAGYVSESYLKYLSTDAGTSATPSPGQTADAGATVAYGRVTGSGVNFRKGPATSYNSISTLSKNAELIIYATQGTWYYASYNGVMGYISTSYVEITGYGTVQNTPNTATPTPSQNAPLYYSAVAADNAPLYDGPSASNNVIGTLALGTQVAVFAQSGDWYQVSAGWYSGYLNKSALTAAPVQSTPTPQPSGTVVSTGYINNGNTNFRSGPDLSQPVIDVLNQNTPVYVYSVTGTWYYVLAGTRFGYVHQDYVTITGTATLGADGSLNGNTSTGGAGKGVTTGNVQFRSGPSTSYGSLGTLAKNTELTLNGEESGWYKVTLQNGKTGYVSGKYIKVLTAYTAPSTPNTGTSNTVMGEGVTTEKVNFRTGPTTSAKKITQLKKGAKLKLISLSNGWYAVEYNGSSGYVSAKYVKQTGNSTSSSGTIAGSGTQQSGGTLTFSKAKATGTVNFRAEGSTSARVLQTLAKGAAFELLGQTTDWYYVLYGGTAGFIHKNYVSVESSGSAGVPQVSASTKARNAVTTANVNLRAGAGTGNTVLQLLNKSQSCTSYLVTVGWHLVSCNGKIGYVTGDYVKLA